jgi:DNA invertase Pin-like site-specific DNA recombinase
MSSRFVAYYRVSTAKQGASGLGLEAQRRAVAEHLQGTAGELVGEFEEIETGKRADRPALAAAIERCRLTGSRLLIAKLDRLSRNVHFLTGLEEQGVDFVACDMPEANRLTVHIMAAVAQQEREAISARTKAALWSIKARLAEGGEHVSRRSGQALTKLGSPRGLSVSRPDLGTKAKIGKADHFADRVRPTLTSLRGEGLSLGGVAARLNEMRVRTPRGGEWTATGVKRVLDRVPSGGGVS